jgi:FkbM family methyltransferase
MPKVRGRHRLERWWLRQSRPKGIRIGRLPGGASVGCDLSIPFEAMVWLGREENDDLTALSRLLRRGETFVDIGANIGTWTLQAASIVGPTGHVFAFEPNPATVEKLRGNILRNDFSTRVTVVPIAVSDRAGTVPFECHRDHNVSHIADAPSERTTIVTSDTVDRSIPIVSVEGMKIDVEGRELTALTGAAVLIDRSHPWIVIEFNLDVSPVDRLADWPVHQWLTARGYRPQPLPSSGTHEVTESYRPQIRRYANILYRWQDPVRA